MTIVENIAENLKIDSNDLIYKGVRSYLLECLREIEIEIFELSRKYDTDDIEVFWEKVKSGDISEEVGYEDSFLLDNLLQHKEILDKALCDLPK